MDYKSPIEVFYSDVQLKFEEDVYKAVQAVDIHVDRDELIKALQYDRQQYEKGWHDAMLKEQKTSQWISVKDRLPTYAELKDECVLVLLDDGAICSTGFDECIEGKSIFGEWRQNFDPVTLGATDSDWMPLEGVTHWMPLPELPKEDDNARLD